MAHALIAILLFAWSVAAAALNVQLDIGSVEHPSLPVPIKNLHLACELDASDASARCDHGVLRALLSQQAVEVTFDGRLHRNGDWRINGKTRARGVTLSEPSGRYATEKLDLSLQAQARRRAGVIEVETSLSLPAGQAYVEPVFVDFAAAPARLEASLRLEPARRLINLQRFLLEQTGVLRAEGRLRKTADAPAEVAADFDIASLGAAFASYAQPFLAGRRMEKTQLSGAARGHVETRGAIPQSLDLVLKDAGLELVSYASGLRDLQGEVHWRATGETRPSQLRWSGGHVAKLELGASELHFSTRARDVELRAPLRVPMANGALALREFAVRRAGEPDMEARLDAELEPLDLAALCRAFGWPEFGGNLSGRLPGVTLSENELRLDGALHAKAFDGEIEMDRLRVLDPLGRLPRVLAELRMRKLDLAAVTGAFSFGRIEGRLNADIEDLRLLDWSPVAFRARLYTPPGDKSRHRISQRAIDNISSIGGGPTGVLSRGALRFFEDFAYDRIGWSCELANGVCRMDGIEPAKGGYVLVKGRLLPRIDVVGFQREVDWNVFLRQLQSVRQSDRVEVR
jgi:hypothetical protein